MVEVDAEGTSAELKMLTGLVEPVTVAVESAVPDEEVLDIVLRRWMAPPDL